MLVITYLKTLRAEKFNFIISHGMMRHFLRTGVFSALIMQRWQIMKGIFLGMSLLASLLSYANEQDDLRVHVRVKPACHIKSYTRMHWPPLSGTFPTNIDNTTGSVTTYCTRGIYYTVGINNGRHYDAHTETRRLSNHHGHFVHYAIYSDAGFSIPWKNVGTPYALPLLATGLDQTNTLYARIPHGQHPVPAGEYQDSLIVTIHF